MVWQRNGDTARLHCPCHLSNFDMEGHVLNGPATIPLQRYKVRVEGDDAIVTLTRSGSDGRKATSGGSVQSSSAVDKAG